MLQYLHCLRIWSTDKLLLWLWPEPNEFSSSNSTNFLFVATQLFYIIFSHRKISNKKHKLKAVICAGRRILWKIFLWKYFQNISGFARDAVCNIFGNKTRSLFSPPIKKTNKNWLWNKWKSLNLNIVKKI